MNFRSAERPSFGNAGPSARDFDDGPRGSAGQASPLELFDQYARETKLAPATIRRWRAVMAKIEREHPRVAGISREWCMDWKHRLAASGLSDHSISNVYLASLRVLCRWAVANGEMASDPTDGIAARVQRRRLARPKAFTTGEVETILAVTLEPAPRSLTSKHAAARRWVPWLCAHLGARIGEIVRLRGSDVRQVDGIWLVSIRPDDSFAARAKMRVIPLHPQLVEQGFPRFVEESGDGPLFHDLSRQSGGRGGVDPAQKVIVQIGRWVRQLGVDDPDVLPNHAWRHRFQMTAIKSNMNRAVLDYLLGRAPAMPRKWFVDFTPHVLLREISKLPRIEIKAADTPSEPQRKPIADDATRIDA